jgi:hypothetical protein
METYPSKELVTANDDDDALAITGKFAESDNTIQPQMTQEIDKEQVSSVTIAKPVDIAIAVDLITPTPNSADMTRLLELKRREIKMQYSKAAKFDTPVLCLLCCYWTSWRKRVECTQRFQTTSQLCSCLCYIPFVAIALPIMQVALCCDLMICSACWNTREIMGHFLPPWNKTMLNDRLWKGPACDICTSDEQDCIKCDRGICLNICVQCLMGLMTPAFE